MNDLNGVEPYVDIATLRETYRRYLSKKYWRRDEGVKRGDVGPVVAPYWPNAVVVEKYKEI